MRGPAKWNSASATRSSVPVRSMRLSYERRSKRTWPPNPTAQRQMTQWPALSRCRRSLDLDISQHSPQFAGLRRSYKSAMSRHAAPPPAPTPEAPPAPATPVPAPRPMPVAAKIPPLALAQIQWCEDTLKVLMETIHLLREEIQQP